MKLIKMFINSISFSNYYFSHKLPLNMWFKSINRYRKLFLMHEMEIDEFFLFELENPDLSFDDCAKFIGWKKHIKTLIHLNPVEYRCLTENKLVFYTYCKAMNISTPEVYALYNPQISTSIKIPGLKDIAGLKSFLKGHKISDIVIKPVDGTKGQSILVLQFHDNKFFSPDKAAIDEKDIESTLSGYVYRDSRQVNFLIQKQLKPHESTLKLSSNVPFSYRVLTILNENGHPEVLEIYGKASRNNITDNYENGGLILRIDQKGICQGAIIKAEPKEVLENHPDNNFRLKDWPVPMYREVIEIALKAASAFYFVKCVAWDIIVSSEGVFIIEGNNPWNGIAQQKSHLRGLWQGTLKKESERLFQIGIPRSPWW